jgi:dipeptidyl aminopeptidase/acylaminoacyl peptidase
MLQHEDAFLQQYEKSLLGDPEKDRQIYEDDSPLKYIRNEKAPLLVLQGENDPRVPKEEAEQVVDILKQQGRTVDVHYYPKEGHGFSKRENQIDALKRTTDWFDKYLKPRNVAAR